MFFFNGQSLDGRMIMSCQRERDGHVKEKEIILSMRRREEKDVKCKDVKSSSNVKTSNVKTSNVKQYSSSIVVV